MASGGLPEMAGGAAKPNITPSPSIASSQFEVDAEVEVAVGLVGLVNFDLFERGYYAIRATASFERYAL